jgi:hypothetical protein
MVPPGAHQYCRKKRSALLGFNKRVQHSQPLSTPFVPHCGRVIGTRCIPTGRSRLSSNFVFNYRHFGAQKRHFHIGERVIPQISLLHVLNFSVRIFDSFGVNRAELRVQILLKQVCLLVLERLRDGFFQLFYCRLFGRRSDGLKPGGTWTWTGAWTFLTKANGSRCNQAETTKNELSFHGWILRTLR